MAAKSKSVPVSSPDTSAPSFALKNHQGAFFAYNHREYGPRFHARDIFARKYTTQHGARIARSIYARSWASMIEIEVVPLSADA